MKYELTVLRDRVRAESSLPALAELANTAFRHVKSAPAARSACKSGCSHCCSQNIHPTLPELARILQEIEGFTDEEKSALKARVAAVAEIQKDHTVLDGKLSGPCVMLRADGACSIYKARPLVCRGMNSMSVESCKRGKPLVDPNQMSTGARPRTHSATKATSGPWRWISC